MEFYDGFKWAVPKAFKDALAACSFDEGDTLYSTRLAYGTWGEVVDKIEHAIQVRSKNRADKNEETVDIASLFKNNWNSSVQVEFFIGGGLNNTKKVLDTTQGRLFTLLRTGNIDILNTELENPSPLLLADSLKTHLKDNNIVEFIKNSIDSKYDNPNLVLMAYDESNEQLVKKFKTIMSSLYDFDPKIVDFTLDQFKSMKSDDFHPLLFIRAIVIDSKAPEKIRDSIKEVLWPTRDSSKSIKSFHDVITRERSVSAKPFKLENHVNFLPFQIKKYGDIRVHSFNHSPIYRYRLHNTKIEHENNTPKSLKNFLNLVFADCPNHLFAKSSFRVSKINFNVDSNMIHHENHTLINIAKESRVFKKFKSRHENLEQYLLDNDNGTIAVELPLWIENGEFKDYDKIFKTSDALTGHIDILRIENDGRIAIWDYKPNAFNESKAHIQVFLYAYMLSVRTGIKLSNFTCGYFDELDLYQFNPSEAILEKTHNKKVQ